MHPLIKIIFALLMERHGQLYAEDKCAELAGKSYADVLAWAVVHLDPRNQAALAGKLGLDADVMRTLRRAFDAARLAK